MENFLENLLADAIEMQTTLYNAKRNDELCLKRMNEMMETTTKRLNDMFSKLGLRGVYVYVGGMNGASAPIIICDPARLKTTYTIGHIQCPWEEHTIHGKKYTKYSLPHIVKYEPHSTSLKVSYGNDIHAFLKGCEGEIREILFQHLEATK